MKKSAASRTVLLCYFFVLAYSYSQAYSDIDITRATTDAAVKDSLNFGANEVIQKALNAGKIYSTSFTVSTINSMQEQIMDAITYKFNVDLTDGRGTTIGANFFVYYMPWKEARELLSSYYTLKTVNASNAPAATANYTNLTQADLLTNEDLKASLNFGLQQVLEQGYQLGKVPVSDYTIVEYARISRQVTLRGNSYIFQIIMMNSRTIEVVTTFTVYSPRVGSRSLTAYSFNVYGIPA